MLVALLGKLLDYFLNPEHSWMFGNDIHRALAEFSGNTGPVNEDSYEHFLDWFLFDFCYRGGETPLAYACRTNPLAMSDADIATLKTIVEKNCFGYFEVTATGRDCMTFKAVEGGEQYEIADTEASIKSKKGDVFVCRIAPVGGAWRVINSCALAMRPSTRDWEKIRSHPLRDSRETYNEIVRAGAVLPDLDALKYTDGNYLVSGGAEGWSPDEDDDCPICRLMKKAKNENRKPSHKELMRAFRETNSAKDHK